MATIHSNSARDTIQKLCTLPLLAGENVSAAFVVPTVASAIDIVVHLEKSKDGRRRVREIAAVPGRVEDGVVEVSQLFWAGTRGLERADGFPPHRERFERSGFNIAEIFAGGLS